MPHLVYFRILEMLSLSPSFLFSLSLNINRDATHCNRIARNLAVYNSCREDLLQSETLLNLIKLEYSNYNSQTASI